MWEFILIAWLNGAIILQTDYQFESKQTCDDIQQWTGEKVKVLNRGLPKDSLYEVTKCSIIGVNKKVEVMGMEI